MQIGESQVKNEELEKVVSELKGMIQDSSDLLKQRDLEVMDVADKNTRF